MIHKMKLRSDPFDKIVSGKKTIEIRLYDEKRRNVKENDIIEFANLDTSEVIRTKVVKLHLFRNFKELFEYFDNTFFGYDNNDIINYEMMYDYYTKEDENKYGVVGIEIILIKGDE